MFFRKGTIFLTAIAQLRDIKIKNTILKKKLMVELNVNEVLLQRDAAATGVVRAINSIDQAEELGDAAIYHKFPFYSSLSIENSINTDVLFLSQQYGILIFKCLSFSDLQKIYLESVKNKLDDLDRLIYAKILKDAPRLQKNRRDLKINITPVLYMHNCDNIELSEFHGFEFNIVNSQATIRNLIFDNKKEVLTDEDYRDLKATIEGSKGIPKPISRKIKSNQSEIKSKGDILVSIESDIYNFDLEQKKAALFTIDGPQRIRGLAGSGKTVILAMKAAMIHLQNPEATVLYTYYTKSLYDTVKRLITRFYRQFSEKDPNWDKIHIMHAWGGKSLAGVYYNACITNNLPVLNLLEAKRFLAISKSIEITDPFDYACKLLNDSLLKIQYDYSLLDEAQDFPKHFYRICRQITHQNKVVWAYDDFQNILNVTLQNEKETFGKDANGSWHIDFSRREDELQDLVLHKCYRNPRKILTSAFALGLGIYNEDNKSKAIKMVQRLENNDHWEDLGFEVEVGDSSVGAMMTISRPEVNSPLSKNKYLDDENSVIKVISFDYYQHECAYVVERIIEDIENELNPEDITVICLDDFNARQYFKELSTLLLAAHINTFDLIQTSSDNISFRVNNHVTLSTIYKAKGNESGSIYIIGIDSVFSVKDDIKERNKIFTAITRAKGWVTLTGINPAASICGDELNKLSKNNFKLIFKQPSENEVKTIRQDIDKKQAVLNKLERMADELAKDLDVSKDDLFEDLKNLKRKK